MNRAAQAGGAGQRCALNLGGIGADEIERGDWIVASHLHAPTARFDVQLTLSPHAPAALRHWAPVHLHLAASHVMARVALPESVARLAALVQELEHATGEARAAEFRDRSGLSRKRAIQVLEFFDRVGYTRRVREAHRLRNADMFGRAEHAA